MKPEDDRIEHTRSNAGPRWPAFGSSHRHVRAATPEQALPPLPVAAQEPPPPEADREFSERHDDPRQAEELERQQDA